MELLGNQSEFIKGLMKALGIEADHVKAFSLYVRFGEIVALETEQFVVDRPDEVEFKRYRLTKEEIVEPDEGE